MLAQPTSQHHQAAATTATTDRNISSSTAAAEWDGAATTGHVDQHVFAIGTCVAFSCANRGQPASATTVTTAPAPSRPALQVATPKTSEEQSTITSIAAIPSRASPIPLPPTTPTTPSCHVVAPKYSSAPVLPVTQQPPRLLTPDLPDVEMADDHHPRLVN